MPYHILASSLPFLSTLFSSILHFLSYSYIPYLLLYFSFLLFSLLSAWFSLFLLFFTIHSKGLLYCLPWRVLLFYPSTTFDLLCVSFPDGTGLSGAQPSPLPCVGYKHIPFPYKRVLFCFLAFRSISNRIKVGHSLLLTPTACI